MMVAPYKLYNIGGGHMNGLANVSNVADDCPKCPKCRTSKNVKRNPVREVVGPKKIKFVGYVNKYYCTGCGHDFDEKIKKAKKGDDHARARSAKESRK